MRARRAALLLAGALGLLPGCFTPSVARLTFVSTQPDALSAEVPLEEVWGRTCVRSTPLDALLPLTRGKELVGYLDYEYAFAMALRAAPEAALLRDVSVSYEIEHRVLWRNVCGRVRGNAARLR
jgi:hypothetical protein